MSGLIDELGSESGRAIGWLDECLGVWVDGFVDGLVIEWVGGLVLDTVGDCLMGGWVKVLLVVNERISGCDWVNEWMNEPASEPVIRSGWGSSWVRGSLPDWVRDLGSEGVRKWGNGKWKGWWMIMWMRIWAIEWGVVLIGDGVCECVWIVWGEWINEWMRMYVDLSVWAIG